MHPSSQFSDIGRSSQNLYIHRFFRLSSVRSKFDNRKNKDIDEKDGRYDSWEVHTQTHIGKVLLFFFFDLPLIHHSRPYTLNLDVGI